MTDTGINGEGSPSPSKKFLKAQINEPGNPQTNYGTTRENSSSKIRLKKEIGLFEAIGITVGAIVGSGKEFCLSNNLNQIPSLSLFIH